MEPLAGSKSPVEHSSLVRQAGPEEKRGAKDVHDSPLSLGTRGLIISACRQNSSSERRIKRRAEKKDSECAEREKEKKSPKLRAAESLKVACAWLSPSSWS